eukprot:903890-Prymnesium_polylepis.1
MSAASAVQCCRFERCALCFEGVAGGCVHGASRAGIRTLRAAGRAAAVRALCAPRASHDTSIGMDW